MGSWYRSVYLPPPLAGQINYFMKKEDFTLKKFKVDKRGKMEAKFEQNTTDGEASYADTHEVKSPRIIHPDLKKLMDGLKMTMAVSNDLLPHRNLPKISPTQQKQLDKMSKMFHEMDEDILAGITVTGVAIQGANEEEDKRSVVLTGKRDVKGKNRERYTSVAMNSPKISLSGDIFGFEGELADDLNKIIDEVYLYFAERKGHQTEMAFNSEEETAEEPVEAKK